MKFLENFLIITSWAAAWILYLVGTLLYSAILKFQDKEKENGTTWFSFLFVCYNTLMNTSSRIQEFVTDNGEKETVLEFPWNRN